jgi:predicted outer membrane protein
MIRTLLAGGAVLAVLALFPVPAQADPGVQLNANDMALLNGVRQAGLWEMPAGQMAAQKGSSAKVRQVGQAIADQHVKLDQLVTDAANALGTSLPQTPTAQQQGFLNQLQAATGPRFDLLFVTLLRGAHGKIFPIIGAVRAATRNPIVRKLADQANQFVMNHMQMLESTGLVQYERLPPAAMPPAQDLSTLGMAEANAGVKPPFSPLVLGMMLIGLLGIGALASVRIMRSRR